MLDRCADDSQMRVNFQSKYSFSVISQDQATLCVKDTCQACRAGSSLGIAGNGIWAWQNILRLYHYFAGRSGSDLEIPFSYCSEANFSRTAYQLTSYLKRLDDRLCKHRASCAAHNLYHSAKSLAGLLRSINTTRRTLSTTCVLASTTCPSNGA
jgi:hypothetical protein